MEAIHTFKLFFHLKIVKLNIMYNEISRPHRKRGEVEYSFSLLFINKEKKIRESEFNWYSMVYTIKRNK